MKKIIIILFSIFVCISQSYAEEKEEFVAIVNMDMMILPGTQAYLDRVIKQSHAEGAKAVIVLLDTPGGMLNTSQEMIQLIFSSPIPVLMYVSPTGATATSAGVFITLSGHVAAMAPGTSIGAAHPVAGDGKDLQEDMRKKAENMTIAMVKSISEQRGRNVEWAEKSVKESDSITESEALKLSVIDLVADDINDLLKKAKGKKVKINGKEIVLDDYSSLPKRSYKIVLKEQFTNFLANPNIAALLWLGATTGLSLELYNPGAILPGVVGVICLILALIVTQIIPISYSGLALLLTGAILIGAELYIPSGILGLGGVIAIVLGSIYLIDVSQAPTLAVSLELIIPVAIILGALMLAIVYAAVTTLRRQATTGTEGLVGMFGTAENNITKKGKVFVNGEIWNAVTDHGLIQKGSRIEVVGMKGGLVLEVKEVEEKQTEIEE